MANSKFIVKHGLKVGAFEVDASNGNITTTGTLTINGSSPSTSSSTETLTNKTVNLSSNTLTGTLAEFNTALSDANFASLAGTETLTNKTISLGSNTVSGTIAQFNSAVSDADLATLAGTETLTNKTISGSSNTLSNIGNASLTNSSVTINGSSLSLGDSLTLDSDDVGEGTTNLYFTNTRARGAVSATDAGGLGSFSYNSGTGAFTYTGPSNSDVRGLVSVTDSGGDGSLSYDSSTGVFTYTGPSASEVRAHFSVTDSGGDGSLSYNSSTGVFTYTGPSASEVRAHFSAGTGVTISSGAISIGQAVGTSSNVTFGNVTVSGTLTSDDITSSSISIDGNATITGNLTVQGTTTTVNSTTVSLGDNIIVLNGGETGSPTLNAGLEVERGTSDNVFFRWNETDDVWQYTNDGTTFFNIVGTTATQTLTNKTIAAGSNTITGLTNTNLSGSAGITNANLANSAITVNGTSISLGASGTIKASTTNALTIGTGLSGSSFDGGSAVTIAIDSSVVTLTGTQTLTNKTLTSPTMTTPTLGVASATSINKVAITAPASSATLTIADGKTLTASNTLTFTGTDSSSVAFGGGGTVAYTSNKLSAFAATTSAELAGVISDETGSGALVFGTSPTFTTKIVVPVVEKSGSDGVGDIGQSANKFANVYATTFRGVSTTAQYADLAEKYSADADYEPGTVLAFGGEAEVTLAADDMTRKVAGVVTTAPAHLMNSELGGVAAAIALQGRVPCKVVGPVAKGDMMVAAGNGRARAEANPVLGSVIGKALENFEGGEGVIEVAVGRL